MQLKLISVLFHWHIITAAFYQTAGISQILNRCWIPLRRFWILDVRWWVQEQARSDSESISLLGAQLSKLLYMKALLSQHYMDISRQLPADKLV